MGESSENSEFDGNSRALTPPEKTKQKGNMHAY